MPIDVAHVGRLTLDGLFVEFSGFCGGNLNTVDETGLRQRQSLDEFCPRIGTTEVPCDSVIELDFSGHVLQYPHIDIPERTKIFGRERSEEYRVVKAVKMHDDTLHH